MSSLERDRYRWTVLAAGFGAQASFAAFVLGLPVLAPDLRAEYGLTLPQISVVFAGLSAGILATVFVWGLAADRLGERRVLVAGLGACAVGLAGAAYAPGFGTLVASVTFAGAGGAVANSATGRAVMHWFAPDERGFALGLRQTAIPAGGFLAALGLPALEAAGGVEGALLTLAGLALAGALASGVLIRERRADVAEAHAVPWTLRDTRLLRLCLASGFYVVPQTAIVAFVVLFLHDARGFSTASAGGVLAAIQFLAVVLRIGAGRWSDLLGTRIVPLRRIGLSTFLAVSLVATLTRAPAIVLVPALIAAGGLSMAWNGLSLTAAAELAGTARSGAAIGVQQTFLAVGAIVTPVAFAATVAAASWWSAFGLVAFVGFAGWWTLGPLAER